MFQRRTTADPLSKSNRCEKSTRARQRRGRSRNGLNMTPSQRAYGRMGRGSAARIYVGWTTRAAWAVSGCAIAALSLPHGDMTIRPFARPQPLPSGGCRAMASSTHPWSAQLPHIRLLAWRSILASAPRHAVLADASFCSAAKSPTSTACMQGLRACRV